MKRLILLPTLLFVLIPLSAGAETAQRSGRATGFFFDFELGASVPSWSFHPQVVLGGQMRRVAVGGIIGAGVHQTTTLDSDGVTYVDSAEFSFVIGPAVDIKLWSRSAAELFLALEMPLYMYGPSFDLEIGIDSGIGGRWWVARWFSVGLKVGSNLVFDAVGSFEVGWGIYGAFCLRFVAGS